MVGIRVPTRRVLKSALHAFLGTYTSRSTAYDGYWLFGFLVGDLSVIEMDLLAPADATGSAPARVARALAVAKFAEQLAKAGLARDHVRAARLVIERLAPTTSLVEFQERSGFQIRFRATVTADTGLEFAEERIVFVAPHDARLERRSGQR